MRAPCAHPPERRWQGRAMWMCCACNRWWWGVKAETPPEDIYGVPT